MVTFGGIGDMVLGALISGALLLVVALVLSRWLGVLGALSWAGLFWWVGVIGLVTLIPATRLAGPVTVRNPGCQWEVGAYTAQGFWIFDGDQRTLNTLLFLPAGVLLVLAVSRRPSGFLLGPLGLAALAAYSVGIELTQLELARIDRACDVTDIVDNVTGAVVGFGVGLLLMLLVQPWKRGPRRTRPASGRLAP